MEPPVAPRLKWAQEVAEQVLADAGVIFPPVFAHEILKRYADVVIFDAKFVQGFCTQGDDGNYVVGFNKRYSYYRHGWTYAHELGHIVMDHHRYRRELLAPENVSALRHEAEWFAANLLMPEKWMRQLFDNYGMKSFDDLRRYVHMFGVSWKAMQIRFVELKLCTNEEMEYIAKGIC